MNWFRLLDVALFLVLLITIKSLGQHKILFLFEMTMLIWISVLIVSIKRDIKKIKLQIAVEELVYFKEVKRA